MNSLKNCNVLVTGGAGFIGSTLVRELIKVGANVIVYDNLLYGDKSNLSDIEKDMTLVIGDVISGKIFDTLKKYNIDYVFNLAAEPYIPHSYDNPEKFFQVNVNGTINLLSACRTFNVKRIIHVSTSEVYGTGQIIPMNEKHPLNPLSTYAVSKLAGDRAAFVFSYERNIPVVIVRPFNSYGPRETQPYIIPEIIRQLFNGKTLHLGNIDAKRDFTYVEDTALGMISVMTSNLTKGEVVNIGSNKSYSIKDIAILIGKEFGYDNIDIQIDKTRLRPLDVELLESDYSKINKLTGWKPTVDIKEGLKRTVQWYLNNGKKWSWERFSK